MREAVICAAVRTAIGKRNGSLAEVHPVDLSADVLNAVVNRVGIEPDAVDDVVWGCVSQVGDQSSNIGRFAVLAAGWPDHIPGVTINRACGSSQQAVEYAAQAVMSGQRDLVVAGGVESMSRVPLGSARATGFPYGPRVLARYDNFEFNQGISAEMIAEQWGLSRQQLDEYSARSHELAAARRSPRVRSTEQIVPIKVGDTTFDVDEGVRPGTSVETLAKLKPVFKDDGVIHAGNASQISDGAAALIVATPERAASSASRRSPVPHRHGQRRRREDDADRPDPGDREAAQALRASASTTSACSRSTRRSHRCRSRGMPRSAATSTGSTRSVARSRSATRSAGPARS